MIRAFVALALPADAQFELELLGMGLGLADPVPSENLHLTLVFLGQVLEPVLEEFHGSLDRLRAPAFDLQLGGLGMFGGSRPRSVHVEVRDPTPLLHLRAKVAAAARQAEIAIDARRFTPHVTLARLRPREADVPRLAQAVAARCDFLLPALPVRDFRLMRSRLTAGDPIYDELARYALA